TAAASLPMTSCSGPGCTTGPFFPHPTSATMTTALSTIDMGPLPGERPRNHDALHLARPFVNRRHAHVAEATLDGKFARVTLATMNLKGGVADAHGVLARKQLRHGRLARKRPAALLEPGRAQRQQAGRLERRRRIGQQEPNGLKVADGPAELLAVAR